MHKTIVLFVTALFSLTTVAGEVYDRVKEKGYIQCGVSNALSGFSYQDENNNWRGFDVDLCRAVAAAMFGDANAVKYSPLTATERFNALVSDEIDILSRNTTYTLSRDTTQQLNFTGISFYDGQGFMVHSDSGYLSLDDFDNSKICVIAGTTSEQNLKDYFGNLGTTYQQINLETAQENLINFESGECEIISADQSQLYSIKSQLKDPETAIIFPDIISKEPLGPVVKHGDDQWFDLVKWALFAMINAEELGISSENIDSLRQSSDSPVIQRFVGTNEGENTMGTTSDWSYQIVKQVGNYGEVFERNVGSESPLNIPRNQNAIWLNGGLLYAPPMR